MHRCENPASVRVEGPLAPFAGGLVGELESLGCARSSAVGQMRLVAHLSRWAGAKGLGPADLTGPVIDSFLAERRAGYANLRSARALAPALRHLRGLGAVPPRRPAPPAEGPADLLLASFGEYMRVQRGATAPVVRAYIRYAAPFVAGSVPGMSTKGAQMTVRALRRFLGFAQLRGLVGTDLSPAVPAVASRRTEVSRALSAEQVGLLLGSCDRSTRAGLRDYAVILCLARLGLRAGELGALELSDLDWVAGTVTVHGKGGRVDRLPLPVDVGEALVAYLRRGRPEAREVALFVAARAPYRRLAPSSVSWVVGRAAARAGLGTIHAHRLRHTAATAALNAGASMQEVSRLLRHASPETTAVYARSDLARLAGISRPWPVGGIR